MLEPRRLATRAVATRMAFLCNEEVGDTIGYRIRFENKVCDHTRIEVVTEGILTRMIQRDNQLEDVGMIIFDEFHERSIHADLALALSLQLQQILREDMRILIMSATLDGSKIAKALGNVPVITSEGKKFPVDIRYQSVENHVPLYLRVAKAINVALREQVGDILAFLPGVSEIKRVQELLISDQVNAVILPLYGDLPYKDQEEAILPHKNGLRKVVLATSIAETSLTIEGITTVIDSGVSRVPRFDPRSGLTKLVTVPITSDTADQRAGRSGRTGPGVCYRLWSQGTNQFLVPHRQPEILEADLAPLVLELANAGITRLDELKWLTTPPEGSFSQASALLHQLGALSNNKITGRGKEMVRLPTHPRLAHMLIEAKERGELILLAIDCASVIEERDPLPKEAGVDLAIRVELLQKYRNGLSVTADQGVLKRMEKLAKNWRKIFNVNVTNNDADLGSIGLLISWAYPDRIAQQLEKYGERYKLTNGRIVRLPSHDALMKEEFLSIAGLDAGKSEGKIFSAASLHKEDLQDVTVLEEVVRWDDALERVVGYSEKKIGSLTLARKPLDEIPHEKKSVVLCSLIREKGLKLIGWSDDHNQFCARVLSLRQWRPEEVWPDVTEENLMNTIETWLGPFLSEVTKQADWQRLNLEKILYALLPWHLSNKLDVLTPLRMSVPSGSLIRLKYFPDGSPPVMEVRLQEVFGLLETPSVNDKRTPVLMHLLSPGFRPVQVTQDLRSFWRNTYSEVRKELRVRYAKHHWPEDPWSAQAVRGVKRKNKE